MSKNYNDIKDVISELGVKTLLNEPMSKHTSFKIGGNAEIFIEVGTINELKMVIKHLKENGIPIFIIGNGSNLLISDDGIEGAVIRLTEEFNQVRLINDNVIECGAGAMLSKLCSFAQQNSLSGLEFGYGIPGSVGGAVFMNAGAYGGEIRDVIISVDSLTRELNIKDRNSKDLDLSYRHSIYQDNNDIILSARFKLNKGTSSDIKKAMDDFMSRRKQKQPLEYPSAGSVFKRPVRNYAGTLIQSCGLKGKRIGGAMVSEKHAGFIVNVGNATCKDVTTLIDHIKAVVLEKTGVVLESEIRVIGRKIT